MRLPLPSPAGRPAPLVTPDAVAGLKFGDVLPPELASETLARRMIDQAGAADVLAAEIRWVVRD